MAENVSSVQWKFKRFRADFFKYMMGKSSKIVFLDSLSQKLLVWKIWTLNSTCKWVKNPWPRKKRVLGRLWRVCILIYFNMESPGHIYFFVPTHTTPDWLVTPWHHLGISYPKMQLDVGNAPYLSQQQYLIPICLKWIKSVIIYLLTGNIYF